ncbi:Hypothetical protein MALK_0920 [Metamycoplasma alkalescens 14918]|uniref:ICEF-IIA n=1 Tax=Metamycoplasma alkalescens 14918 TaxID=1188234 RepID=N9UBY5_9BACT|nr:hypothetical protein [Metamycoplasma alkalescens]ENY54196.1 Hypothetical protein MALK_0920 [Metamycoplasma alkalescens 14918]
MKKIKNKKLWLLFLSPISFIPIFAISTSSNIRETKYYEFPKEWEEETIEDSTFSPGISYSHLWIFDSTDKYKWEYENHYSTEIEGSHGYEWEHWYDCSHAYTDIIKVDNYDKLIDSLGEKIDFMNNEKEKLENEIKENLKKWNINLNSVYKIEWKLAAKEANLIQQRSLDVKEKNLTDLHIKFHYKKTIIDERKKFKNSWYKWKNQILNNQTSFTISTDTGGKLDYEENDPRFAQGNKSNKYYLDQYISNLNDKFNAENDLKLRYLIKDSNEHIDLFLEKNNIRSILAKNIKINFNPTNAYTTRELVDRLKIKLGNWVDFEKNTTQLVPDELIRDPEDKKEIDLKGKKRWGGKWIAHTPTKILFDADLDETEVIKINGKKIDVLDRHFEMELLDNRKNSNDSERIFNADSFELKEDDVKTEDNSHAKNEYKIEILKYAKKGNLDKDLEYTYTKVIKIDSRSSQMNFKWFAWDPQKNPNQKELIEEYLKNETGEILRDKNNNPIPNPKYDPAIDKETGTKKQLVWFDFSKYTKENKMFIDKNKQFLKEKDFSIYYQSNEQKNYYETTKLPYNSKTLFAPHKNIKDLDNGVIMEASVLGKGALKTLIGKNKNFILFKLNEDGYFEKPLYSDDYFLNLTNETSDNSYFSSSGIWLFASNTEKAISNFKLILIKENSNPQSLFTDNLPKISNVKPLFKTKQGLNFYNYLLKNELNPNQIEKLTYEDAIEYYKTYINVLYENQKFASEIEIIPKFKQIPENLYSTNEFKNKYFEDINAFKNLYLDDFDFKELVRLDKLEFNQDKTGVIVSFSLLTNELIYYLNPKIFIPIKFKDVDINKKIINLNLNQEYIIHIAKNSLKSNFLNKLSRKEIFRISEDEFQKLNISYTFNSNINELIINVDLMENYKNEYKLEPSNNFRMIINNFKTKEEDELDNDIFSNLELKEINLRGITNKKEAEIFILNELKKHLSNLEINRDYEIKNLDTVVSERIYPQENISLFNPPISSLLILEAKSPKIGYKRIPIINTVNKILENEFDLATKKLVDFELNENRLSLLKKQIIDEINRQFLAEKFEVNKDIEITNFNSGIEFLAQGKNHSFQFIIKGLNAKIKNQTTINIKNTAKFVVDDEDPSYKPGDENNPEKAILYNLGILKLDELIFIEHVFSELKTKIINEIIKQIQSKYFIEYNKQYKIDDSKLNLLIREIGKKSEKPISKILILQPIEKVSKNTASIKITNHNKLFDPIDDIDNSNNSLSPQEQDARRKKFLLIFIPITILGLVIVGLVIWLIYIRKFKNKIS